MDRKTLPAPRNVSREFRRQKRAVLRVAIYLRVSTRAQVERSGLATQEKDCRAWLDFRLGDTPHEVVGVFIDGGVSGALDERDDKEALDAVIRAGDVDLVIAQKLDRYGRTVRIINDWIQQIHRGGARVVTADDRIDSDDDLKWKVVMPLLAYLAELEHEMIFSRTWNGRETKLAKGGWVCGVPPYGFALHDKGQGSHVVLCEDECQVLAMIAECLIDLGMNYSETAEHLNRHGKRTRSGRLWTTGNLIKRIANEAVLDCVVTYRKDGGGAKRDEETGEPLYGEVTQIPMPEVFPAVRRAQLKERIEELSFHHRRKNAAYPLSGRMVGSCGEAYIGGGVRSEGRRAYRCKGNADGCDDVYLDAEETEDAVRSALVEFLDDPARIESLARRWVASLPSKKSDLEDQVLSLRRQVQEKTDEAAELMRRSVKFKWDEQATEAALAEPNMELTSLRQLLAAAEASLEDYEQAEDQAKEMKELIQGARINLGPLDLSARDRLFSIFDVQVTTENHRFKKRAGVRCAVTEWHKAGGVPVPADVSAGDWADVQAVLEGYYSKISFAKSKIDLRLALNGMLHRLRTGATWEALPPEFGDAQRIRERQLSWWKTGAWAAVVGRLNERGGGTPVYVHPTIPPLRIVGRVGRSLWAVSGGSPESDGGVSEPSGLILPGSAHSVSGRTVAEKTGTPRAELTFTTKTA